MKRIIISAVSLVAGVCFAAPSSHAEDFDLSQATAVKLEAGIHPITVSTAMTAVALVTADAACGLTFSSSLIQGVLTIEPSGSNLDCAISLVMPENFAALKLNSSIGGIIFSGNIAKLEIDGSNSTTRIANSSLASLNLTNTNGDIFIDTVLAKKTRITSSNAKVSIIKLTSSFNISATNGAVQVRSSKIKYGSKNFIQAVNGNVLVSGLKVIAPAMQNKARLIVKGKAINGSVRLKGQRLKNGSYTVGSGHTRANLSISTINSDITVR